MSPLVVKRTKPARDCERLSKVLRKEDAAECYAACGHSPLEALWTSFKVSQECYSVFDGLKQLAMFGVLPLGPKVGGIWMLCADLSLVQSIDILRQAPGFIDRFERLYPTLTNVVDARNALHIKWLKHLGFTFTELIPEHGFEGRPFHQFYRGIPLCAMQPH